MYGRDMSGARIGKCSIKITSWAPYGKRPFERPTQRWRDLHDSDEHYQDYLCLIGVENPKEMAKDDGKTL